MWHLQRYLALIAVTFTFAAGLAGCAQQPSASSPAGTDQAADGVSAVLDDETATALSQLSDADRAAAIAQKVCPVSDKPLGSMGKPPRVAIDGQDVFLCCLGCEDTIKSDPARYLAKLRAQ
jgi:hypothetical protein